MGYTILIEGHEKQPSKKIKVYLKDKYGDGSAEANESFADYIDNHYTFVENGLIYEWETVYENPFPQMELTSFNWLDISKVLGLITDDGYGEILPEEIPEILRKCISVINVQNNIERLTSEDKELNNWFYKGRDEDYVKRRLEELINILKFAKNLNKKIYWC